MALPTHVSTIGSAASGASAPTSYGTTQINDIIIQTLQMSGSISAAATPPAGWNVISTVRADTNVQGTEQLLITIWKRATANGESAPTWTGLTGYRFWTTTILRDCPTEGDVIHLEASGSKDTASTSWPSISLGDTTVDDCMILYFGGTDINGTPQMSDQANATLDGGTVTKAYDTGVSATYGCSRNVCYGFKSAAGSTGTFTATISNSVNIWSAIAVKGITSGGRNAAPDFFHFFT
jgi:hypothetical protein